MFLCHLIKMLHEEKKVFAPRSLFNYLCTCFYNYICTCHVINFAQADNLHFKFFFGFLSHILVKKIVCCLLWQNIKVGCFQRFCFKGLAHLNCLLCIADASVFFYFSGEFPKRTKKIICIHVHFIYRNKTLTCIRTVDIALFITHSGHEWSLFCVS